MLTTDTAGRRAATGPLAVAAAASLVVGGVLGITGAVVSGAPAAWGAMLGAVGGVVVLASGSFAVDGVATRFPAASLLFAMVTYTFQVVLLALLFVLASRSGLLDGTVDRRWLGGAAVACALVWSVVQLRVVTTARIPAYEGGAG